MKIETVNPIPAALPVANKSNRPMVFGSSEYPNLLNNFVKERIPIAFPITKAKKMPIAIWDANAAEIELNEIGIPQFAMAKSGSIKKLDQG